MKLRKSSQTSTVAKNEVTSGPAQWQEMRQFMGRRGGKGMISLSKDRLSFFVPDRAVSVCSIQRSHITHASLAPIPREVRFEVPRSWVGLRIHTETGAIGGTWLAGNIEKIRLTPEVMFWTSAPLAEAVVTELGFAAGPTSAELSGVLTLRSVQPASLKLFNTMRNEEPIAGGPGRIKEMDKLALDAYIEKVGNRTAMMSGPRLLEADWIGTSNAIYYVIPRIGSFGWLLWSELSEISVLEEGMTKTTLRLIGREDDGTPSTEALTLETSNVTAKEVLNLWSRFGS